MSGQYTPGPNEAYHDTELHQWQVLSGGEVLATGIHKKADAVLFAAAPELVEVLVALIRLCPSKEGLGGRAPIGAFLLLGDRARAVLKKAGLPWVL